jgi:hypothetical protein
MKRLLVLLGGIGCLNLAQAADNTSLASKYKVYKGEIIDIYPGINIDHNNQGVAIPIVGIVAHEVKDSATGDLTVIPNNSRVSGLYFNNGKGCLITWDNITTVEYPNQELPPVKIVSACNSDKDISVMKSVIKGVFTEDFYR